MKNNFTGLYKCPTQSRASSRDREERSSATEIPAKIANFSRLEVSHLPQGLLINQHKYLKELLTEFHCESASPVAIPLDMSIKLTPTSEICEWLLCDTWGSPIALKSKKQPTISLASAKAEYMALRKTIAALTWLVRLLADLGRSISAPILLYCDNTLAISIAKNPISHKRTKHIELDYHFVRKKLVGGLISLNYIPTASQLADIFTKPLTRIQHQFLLSKLGVFSPSSLRQAGVRLNDGPTHTGSNISEEEIDPGPR
uniref:Copia protein n=1 Tax=Nicotiana tabacum TaxID=4097 RepID=A0A1S3Y6C9_TOBAC|nr:PREDICTED: uncharacterized protein LOC107772776 [Nicotiana tabacum]